MFGRSLKYLVVLVIPASVAVAFVFQGAWVWFPLLFTFGFLPLMELMLGEDKRNLTDNEKARALSARMFDWILFLMVPLQVFFLYWFLRIVSSSSIVVHEYIGLTISMGLMCGIIGINVAHELGHRTTLFEQVLSRILLSTSLYLHFFIEHNRGHHRNVATFDDPATARRGESIYRFWIRVVPSVFMSAWMIVRKERERKSKTVWSFGNEMIQYQLMHLLLLVLVFFYFGGIALLCFLGAALFGILLLETVDYIEHYGLTRKKVSEHRYEDVEVWHSWNSDYIIGRLVLFELTRHSDHHWKPSQHYQVLDTKQKAGQLPYGYPAMMLMSLLPPLWFKVMDKRVSEVQGG